MRQNDAFQKVIVTIWRYSEARIGRTVLEFGMDRRLEIAGKQKKIQPCISQNNVHLVHS